MASPQPLRITKMKALRFLLGSQRNPIIESASLAIITKLPVIAAPPGGLSVGD
jgi:hypothetical protein